MADSNRLHSINTSRILRTIWLNPGISRIKVAEMLDLDRSTVTKIMQVILDRGLVVTAGKNTEQCGVGRRQINLRINEDRRVVLGVEIQDTRYIAVIATLSGTVLHSFGGSERAHLENLAERALAIIAEARAYAEDSGLFLLGIGIGLPGILDPYTGTILRSHSLGIYEPYAVRADIERHCDIPVFIENDANCCCWGELAFQTENRNRNFIAVLGEFRDTSPGSTNYHGLAVGLGLVVRQRVLHGDHFTAGEFRSLSATPDSGQFSIHYNELVALPENTELLRAVYAELSANLALLVNCVDFTKILFAGDIASRPENLRECMEESIRRNWNYDLKRNITVEFSRSGNRSVCIGAAGLFVEKLFSVPDVADRFQEMVGFDLYDRILNGKGLSPWNM